ncbi:MAG: J domain-containing protein [Planctomycetia bacterium]|nr:J domain-containing protein [Planctomycetia bacterium]
MATDYYKVLGVKKSATKEEISHAYREMARKYHPDLHPDDKTAKQKFQEVQEAFDVLNDDQKRKMYDQFGPNYERMNTAGGSYQGPWGTNSSTYGGRGGSWQQEFSFQDLNDLFRQSQTGGGNTAGGTRGGFNPADLFGMFGNQFQEDGTRNAGRGGRRRNASVRGNDILHDITISFEKSILGGETQVSIQEPSGEIKKVTAKIPPGIEDGKKLRLRGLGEPSPTGGTAGDLVLIIHITPHTSFTRQGNNLILKLPVKISEAVLGAKVSVPTPKGTVELRIPPGTSSGKKLRVKGRGVPGKNGADGDLLVEIMIVVPSHVTEAQQQVISSMDANYTPGNLRSGISW